MTDKKDEKITLSDFRRAFIEVMAGDRALKNEMLGSSFSAEMTAAFVARRDHALTAQDLHDLLLEKSYTRIEGVRTAIPARTAFAEAVTAKIPALQAFAETQKNDTRRRTEQVSDKAFQRVLRKHTKTH